jgi:hypothetical protein
VLCRMVSMPCNVVTEILPPLPRAASLEFPQHCNHSPQYRLFLMVNICLFGLEVPPSVQNAGLP